MKRFIDSDVCKLRRKCHTCRDDGLAGEEFRNMSRGLFFMPGIGFFDCPFGIAKHRTVADTENRIKE
jgi:hypothetical protein